MRRSKPQGRGDAIRTFVLGTGAQKAGTTWLSRYLQTSPEFNRGYRKEYHVFDSLDLASEAWMRRRVVDQAREELDAIARGEQTDGRLLHRLSMLASPDTYFDYFADLVMRDDLVRATGDLTPEHAMLSVERMTAIREEFAARDLRTVAVFLMRDPVERIWSQVRMRAANHPETMTRTTEEELLVDHANPRYALRTCYHETLTRLASSFPADHVHVGLYETMFNDGEQPMQISRLIGITPRRPQRLGQRSNSSPRAVDTLPDDIARAVAETYAETYREVARLRPDLDVARWWPHARFVL